MKKVVLKQTQGNKKLRQLYDDLWRNERSKDFFTGLFSFIKPSKDGISINDLAQDYEKLDKKTKERLKEHYQKLDHAMNEMAERYGLDINFLRPIIFCTNINEFNKLSEEMQEYVIDGGRWDMCFLVDNNGEQTKPIFPVLPIALNKRTGDHIKAFPISIDVHKFASKNDVVDFINKRWPVIEGYLEHYRGGKKKRFRQRKLDQEIVDFIWEHKDKKGKEIKKLLDAKFPDHHLVYYEIPKIISLERKRRLG